MTDALINYLNEIQQILALDNATEHSYRHVIKRLFESLGTSIIATNEPKRHQYGAPDFVISRKHENVVNSIGYVETKAISTNLDKTERSAQIQRYLSVIENFILTDYLEFRWYERGVLRFKVNLLTKTNNSLKINKNSIDLFKNLISGFFDYHPLPTRSAEELALKMARLTAIIRDIIERAFSMDPDFSPQLKDLYLAFLEILVPQLSISEFADMFAQTLTYGLFAARINHDDSKGKFHRLNATTEIPKTTPFLRKLFTSISGPDLEDEPFANFVNDLTEILASADINKILTQFGMQNSKDDPIIHFYETFLTAYNPDLREKRGVYYTPEPIVSYLVKSVDYILRTHFKVYDGLADTSFGRLSLNYEENKDHRKVMILDPACGTGTFLASVIEHIRNQFIKTGNAGLWNNYVKDDLLPRIFGFELQMAPYAMAHLKLTMQLSAFDLPKEIRSNWRYEFTGKDRIGVYLTNSLEEGIKKSDLLLASYFSEEANAAAKIKRDLPIMVVLGNPPYLANSCNKGDWIQTLIKDFYKVDGQPLRERNSKWLQDDYVKFIRFGQWKIQQTGAGILAFITNHGFLENPTFRGMRQQLLKTFTDIYLLDLHGSSLKREKPPIGTDYDENVFDIQPGVSIGIFIKESNSNTIAKVYHSELWGSRDLKYKFLSSSTIERTEWREIAPATPYYLFKPQDIYLQNEYENWWKIDDIFQVKSVGIVTGRDKLVFGFSENDLIQKINAIIKLSENEVKEKYLTEKDKLSIKKVRDLLSNNESNKNNFKNCLYRPFDVRTLFYHRALLERDRQAIMLIYILLIRNEI